VPALTVARCVAFQLLLVAGASRADGLADEAARAADLRQLQQALETQWAYADDKRQMFGLDLPALFRTALDENRAVTTTGDFQRLLGRLVAQLHEGHAGASVADDNRPPMRLWPLTLRDTSNGLLVDAVDASLTEAGLRGLMLVRVDGVPIETLVERALAVTAASTEASRRWRALDGVRATAQTRSTFVFVDAAGVERELTLPTIDAARRSAADHAQPNVGWQRLPRNIGYLQVRSLMVPDPLAWERATTMQKRQIAFAAGGELRAAFVALRSTQALVLDLRGNSGGVDFLGQEIANHLLPAGYVYYRLSVRKADGAWSPALAEIPPPTVAENDVYRRPVVVLIDEGTFSAADNLASCLRDDRPDIRFVGRATAAGTGGPRPVRLANTATLVSFCTIRVFSPHGHSIESHGIIPDVEVQWSRADLERHRDPDLEAALRQLAPRLR
jgi:carboxyl-terminal processing protease